MKCLLRWIRQLFRRRRAAYFISRLPVGMELSDGDKAALYGWPDKTVEEAAQHG